MSSPESSWGVWAAVVAVLSAIYAIARRWFATVTREELTKAIAESDLRTAAAFKAYDKRTDERHTQNQDRFQSQEQESREIKKLILDSNTNADAKREHMTTQITAVLVNVAEISGTFKAMLDQKNK